MRMKKMGQCLNCRKIFPLKNKRNVWGQLIPDNYRLKEMPDGNYRKICIKCSNLIKRGKLEKTKTRLTLGTRNTGFEMEKE